MTKIDTKQPNGMLCWVDLTTDDPEVARAFYGALLGWTFDVGSPDRGTIIGLAAECCSYPAAGSSCQPWPRRAT